MTIKIFQSEENMSDPFKKNLIIGPFESLRPRYTNYEYDLKNSLSLFQSCGRKAFHAIEEVCKMIVLIVERRDVSIRAKIIRHLFFLPDVRVSCVHQIGHLF